MAMAMDRDGPGAPGAHVLLVRTFCWIKRELCYIDVAGLVTN